jgi:2-polyprenyl-3-methyl-5-hydroxy-6-metoxy-1,4-benzoquinol methylase
MKNDVVAMIKIVERNECLACGSVERADVFSLWDDRYAFPEHFQLKQCTNCGSFYSDKGVVEEDLGALYEQYYPGLSTNDVVPKTGRLRIWVLDLLGIAPLAAGFDFKGLKILDVGCGNGESASIVTRSGGEWTGLEIDPKRVEMLNNNGLRVLMGVPESVCDKMSASFDMILASQVIEHTFSPGPFLVACHKLLKPGGRIILSTPNGDSRFRQKYAENWINWHVPYHTVVFSLQGLAGLGEACGYSISIKTLTPVTWWVRQKKHKRPLPGQINRFGEPISVAHLLIAGIPCKIGDWLLKEGDMIHAILRKSP